MSPVCAPGYFPPRLVRVALPRPGAPRPGAPQSAAAPSNGVNILWFICAHTHTLQLKLKSALSGSCVLGTGT